MSLYRYRAKDRKGHKYKGIREGENEAQLVKSLAEDGLYCYFLQNEDRVVSMRHFTVPLKWLPPFCSQVSSMLSSGVPQSDILKTACKTGSKLYLGVEFRTFLIFDIKIGIGVTLSYN